MNRKILFLISVVVLISLGFNNTYFAKVEKVKSKDGVEIAYKVHGSGEPALVFVHGWSCNQSYWDEQVKTFSPKYKVVTLDLAGHGESGHNRKNYTMQLFGADIAAVVNKLKLKKIILVGHSMGGAAVIEAAVILKSKVIGIIGADTYQDLAQTMEKAQAEEFLKPFKENFVKQTSGFVKAMFVPSSDTVLVNKVVKDMSSAPPEIAMNVILNLFTYNALPSLKKIHIPFISINNDRYPIKVKDNAALTKSFELKTMKGIGHFIMLEDPAGFDKLLQESIDELVKMN
ncbi:MAG: alpha/beta hydrolase [Bacteroidetes bacterium]|nr:alpha/beta hydrolase [Bacteroidota bacterium]